MAAITIMGPPSSSVTRILKPVIYTASKWGGEWTVITAAVFKRVLVQVNSLGSSQLEFSIPYGSNLVAAEGPTFQNLSPEDLDRAWVRLELVDPHGSSQVAFVGQVRGEERKVMASTAHGPTGFQDFTAYGADNLLRNCSISHSFWVAPPKSGGGSTSSTGGVVELEWSPDFNVVDKLGFLTGNRSAEKVSGGYVFGGRSLWSRLDAVHYVVDNFLTGKLGGAKNGPEWSVGGQLDKLLAPVEDVPIGLTTTADELLQALLPRSAGLDYAIVPVTDAEGSPTGFEIRVFSLFGSNVSFNGSQLAANPSRVSLDANEADLKQIVVTRDTTKAASKVRVLGARIVMCATLIAPSGPGASGTTSTPSAIGSLVPLWTAAQETAYKLAGSSEIAEENDSFREAMTDGVYEKFGPPATWTPPDGWLPVFDGNGDLASGVAPYQNKVRELLDWIPIIDEDGHPARPLVIARDRRPEIAGMTPPVGPTPATKVWAPVHKLHVGVHVLPNLFGIELTTRPPHKLARGRFDLADAGTSASAFDPSDNLEPEAIDPSTLAATVAWRMDQRLALEASVSNGVDDGTVHEVPAHHPERSELWCVAAGTITDVVNGVPTVAADAVGSLAVVRNDSARLASFMAGVIARYLAGRDRAVVEYHGWKPRLELLGQILETVEQGGQTHGVNAPITCVELIGGMNNSAPTTIVRAGFAT